MSLQKTIEKLEEKLVRLDNKIDENKERLIMVEAAAKQAHKRIDESVRRCES